MYIKTLLTIFMLQELACSATCSQALENRFIFKMSAHRLPRLRPLVPHTIRKVKFLTKLNIFFSRNQSLLTFARLRLIYQFELIRVI